MVTAESGVISDIPADGLDFCVAVNVECALEQSTQFDFYDGGGLAAAFLGLAEMDEQGNSNVFRFAAGFFTVK